MAPTPTTTHLLITRALATATQSPTSTPIPDTRPWPQKHAGIMFVFSLIGAIILGTVIYFGWIFYGNVRDHFACKKYDKEMAKRERLRKEDEAAAAETSRDADSSTREEEQAGDGTVDLEAGRSDAGKSTTGMAVVPKIVEEDVYEVDDERDVVDETETVGAPLIPAVGEMKEIGGKDHFESEF